MPYEHKTQAGSPCAIGVKVLKRSPVLALSPIFGVRKSYPTSSQDKKERMVRPWVKVSLGQYEKLKSVREQTGRLLSEIIREAVSKFVRKKDFPVNTTVSYLRKGTRDKYKSVSAYFLRSDWDLLQEISKNSRKCKIELIRQAVDEYLEK